jgi:single-strand DNA-binding protein
MANLSKVQIIGNVGRDPEQRYTQDGTMRVQFSVAVNNRRRNQDGSFQDETEWYRVTAMGRLAEICQQYVTKGTPVYIDGKLTVSRFTRQDGQPGFSLDVFANDMQLLSSRQTEGGEDERHSGDMPSRPSGPRPMPPRPAPEQDASDLEDLPF